MTDTEILTEILIRLNNIQFLLMIYFIYQVFRFAYRFFTSVIFG